MDCRKIGAALISLLVPGNYHVMRPDIHLSISSTTTMVPVSAHNQQYSLYYFPLAHTVIPKVQLIYSCRRQLCRTTFKCTFAILYHLPACLPSATGFIARLFLLDDRLSFSYPLFFIKKKKLNSLSIFRFVFSYMVHQCIILYL